MPHSQQNFARLVNTHLAGVWGYLRLLGADHALADDLTQETFLVALNKPFEERAPHATLAWLRAIAQNLFLTYRRKESRRADLLEAQAAQRVWSEYVQDESGDDFLTALEDCMTRLDEQTRRALLLRYREDVSGAKAARELEVSESNLHSMVSRGKAALRACIETKMKT